MDRNCIVIFHNLEHGTVVFTKHIENIIILGKCIKKGPFDNITCLKNRFSLNSTTDGVLECSYPVPIVLVYKKVNSAGF